VRKSEQVGLFLSRQKWDIVWLRAQEVTAAISVVSTRWSEELSGFTQWLYSEARRQALKVDESLDGVLEQLAKLDQR
jgi:hypothetical protein